MDQKTHWETIYTTKASTDVSWYQPEPRLSLELIRGIGPVPSFSVIDVGAGASSLVDHLVADGVREMTVLDIAAAAMEKTKSRLGPAAAAVHWIEGDILETSFDRARYDVWHDRAVFHFLTVPEDRTKYLAQVRHSLKLGGHLILATFASDGPLRCSGLDVCRYSAESLQEEVGHGLQLLDARREDHTTPAGKPQAFQYTLFRFGG